MAQHGNTELSGSVRKMIKHPMHKVLYRQDDTMQNGLSVQTTMQGEDALDEYQKVQELKQNLANQKGVAVTSEEHAVEFAKKAEDLKTKSVSDVNDALSQEKQKDDLQRIREVQIAQDMAKESQKKDLLSKIQAEIQSEQERAKLLFAMENARKNAIDAARATYGEKADIGAIQKSYDMMANHLDPKMNDVTDMISMSIDNKLSDGDRVKVLMPNGSIRSMDADVVFAMSELSHSTVSAKKENDNTADVTDELRSEVTYSQAEIDAIRNLQDLMEQNAKKQAMFEYKAPNSGEVEIKSMRDRRALPTVARDYDYIYRMQENLQYKGRQLPSAMSSYTMMTEMQASGKSYGYYV